MEVEFLGHNVSKVEVIPSLKKNAILGISTKCELSHDVAGVFRVYRHFINENSKIAVPLTIMLHKNAQYTWNEEE